MFPISFYFSVKNKNKAENLLCDYRNLGSLRYWNEYFVEYRRLYGKNNFFLFNWSLFESRSYNCTWLFFIELKN